MDSDRQAEQAAPAGVTQTVEPAASNDDATKVFAAVETDEADTSTLDPTDGEADGPEPDPVNDEAEADPGVTEPGHTDDAAAMEEPRQAEHPWAMPEPTGPTHADEAASAETATPEQSQDAAQQSAASEQAQYGEPLWGWPGTGSSTASQSQQQSPPPSTGYGQPPYGYPHQPQQPPYGYGQPTGPQQPYGQAFQPRARQRTPIDLNSAKTWGLFITGGAAFMTLFGFFFGPSVGGMARAMTSHVASGGWLILLLFLATVTLSILQLLKPSAWMRYFLIAVSFGAAFTMIGRTTAVLGFFTLQHTSFSVIWMLFMSLVLLAGIMIYTAPKTSDANDQSQGPSTPPAQHAPQQFGYQQPPMQQPPYGQYPGTPPYGGYGQQTGGYPSGPQQ